MSCPYLCAKGTGTLLSKDAKIYHTCVGGKNTPETALFPAGKRQTCQLLQESSHIRLDSTLKGENLPAAKCPFMCREGPQEFESISFRKHWAAPIAMIIYDFLGLPQKKYNTFRSFNSKIFNTIQCWNLVITFIQFVVTSWTN